jgi:16S rRNA processing protein RimM
MASKKNSSNKGSGSPTKGGPDYLIVGYLRRAHGVHGEMVMEVQTDFPERLKPKTKVFVGKDYQPMTIATARNHSDGLLIKLNGVDTPEDAARYRNQLVYVTAADRPPLPKGQFYVHELIGFEVVDEKESSIGKLTEIMQTGANDVYVVTLPDASEVLLPVISSVVLDIEAERRQIRVRLIPGLLDESDD